MTETDWLKAWTKRTGHTMKPGAKRDAMLADARWAASVVTTSRIAELEAACRAALTVMRLDAQMPGAHPHRQAVVDQVDAALSSGSEKGE